MVRVSFLYEIPLIGESGLKQLFFSVSIIFLLIILGGCTAENKKEEQQIINKATKRTVKYFKEKQDLDVIITDHEFGPNDLQVIFISGHVKDDKSKTFDVAVQYSGNKYTVGSISKSENLQLK
ncbi:hypothetical protein [Bacillus sp. UNC437CL72CviS29]|uniref:hypothetical protein n=1 Tax=Bacillus sp. UNC437CL72CviS29 TaxID=1340430 RepID=UPI001E591290|nr:hypothetical protein [Bacillus sp. UNC437CL72CviS29]